MSHRKSDLGIPLPYIWLNPSTRPNRHVDLKRVGGLRIDGERVLGRERDWQSRGGFLMKLTAAHEASRVVGGLQRGALSG
jgi:hypothetical protein